MGPNKKARAVSMYRRGWSRQDIATALDTTYKVVSNILREAGIKTKRGPKSPTGNTYEEDIALMMQPYRKCSECGHMRQLVNKLCLECSNEKNALHKRITAAARRA